jgi:hypothetical protein
MHVSLYLKQVLDLYQDIVYIFSLVICRICGMI